MSELMQLELDDDCSSNDHWENKGADLEGKGTEKDFYKDAADYWSKIPATIDGMLGGYGFISSLDINGSHQFLKQLFRLKVPPGKGRALDCGAGIGRVTKNLLLNHFKKVDLVEQNPAFVEQAQNSLQSHQNMGNFYCSGLQDFTPESAAYDLIWCQWVLGHLKDDDLIAFLQGCKQGLRENGVIVLKENTTTSGTLDVDTTDSSVTRPLDHICSLLERSGLKCVRQRRQERFPQGLYPVYMIATRPLRQTTPLEEVVSAGDKEKCGDNDICSSHKVPYDEIKEMSASSESDVSSTHSTKINEEGLLLNCHATELFIVSDPQTQCLDKSVGHELLEPESITPSGNFVDSDRCQDVINVGVAPQVLQ